MDDLLTASLPWLPMSLLPAALLLATPLLTPRGRTAVAIALGIGAVFAIGVAVFAGGEPRSLEVVNAFPKGPDGELKLLVFETVLAPAWQWGAVSALMLGTAAVGTYLTRGLTRRPGLVLHPLVVGAWLLTARLLLQTTAAPPELVWATGLTVAMVPFVVFQGLYAARSGRGFKALLGGLIALAVLQRGLVCAVAYWLTTRHLGTHLDFTPLDGFESRFMAEPVVFGDDVVETWRTACVVPQMLMWAPAQILIGLVFGGIAWRAFRRSS